MVEINALVEKKFQERLVTLENELFDRLTARIPTPSLAVEPIEDPPVADNSLSDLWRQSLSTIMLNDEPESGT